MKITVHVRMPCGTVSAIDVDGGAAVRRLYNLAAAAGGVENGTFQLIVGGEVLRPSERETVEGSGLCEGCEVSIVYKDPLHVHVSELDDAGVLEKASAALAELPEGVLVIDVSGVKGELTIDKVPSGTSHIAFVCDAHNTYITRLGDSFLSQCTSLLSLDASSLSQITSIGNYFLTGCYSLTSLDTSFLAQVTSIGDGFLSECTSLTSLDISPLSQLTSIDNCFLYRCTSLTSLDLGPLSRVTSIGTYFLSTCTSLATLDLRPLSRVTSIGDYFLFGCCSLGTLDISPLTHVTSVGCRFLSGCISLTSLDIRPLSQATSIGYYLLRGCFSLAVIIAGDLPPSSRAELLSDFAGKIEWAESE